MEIDEGTSHSTEVAKGTFWGLAGTFIVKILSFAYTIYIAYVVSQGDVGIFNLALGILALITVWKDLGLPTSLTRYVPYYEGKGEHRKAIDLVKYSYAIDAVMGAVLTAAVWLLSDTIAGIYGNAALGEALRLISFIIIIDNFSRVGTSFLQGRTKIAEGQAIGVLQAFSKLAFTVMLVTVNGPTFASLCIGYVASTVVSFMLSIPLVIREAGREKGGVALQVSEITREIAPFGIMLMAAQTFYTIISAMDKVMLGYLAPQAVANEQVAIYSMAVALAGNAMVFPGAVGGIFLPILSKLVGKGDTGQIRRVMETTQRWVIFITLPMLIVMMAFSGEMLAVFFGRSYWAGGTTMAIFLFGLVFSVLSYSANLALAGLRLVKLELKIVALSAVVNVALNFALIPVFGMEGAALAAAASFALAGVLFLHYGKINVGFVTPATSYKLLAASGLLLVLLILSKPLVEAVALAAPSAGPAELAPYIGKISYLVVLGVVSVLSFTIFCSLALLLRCFEREDAVIFRKAARRARIPDRFTNLAGRFMEYGVGKDEPVRN